MLNGRYDQELFYDYGRWLPYITDVFLPISDSESGDLRMLPFPGSLMEQPYMTMQVIYVVQAEYRRCRRQTMEAMMAKTKARRR